MGIRGIWTVADGKLKCLMDDSRYDARPEARLYIGENGRIVRESIQEYIALYEVIDNTVNEIEYCYINYDFDKLIDKYTITYRISNGATEKEISKEEYEQILDRYQIVESSEFEWKSFFE